jgi:hypothetical protein
VVGAGVGEQVFDGLGGGVGEGGVDGDLVFVPVVDRLGVEHIQQPFGEGGGCVGEDVAQVRQLVQQGGVIVMLGGSVSVNWLTAREISFPSLRVRREERPWC